MDTMMIYSAIAIGAFLEVEFSFYFIPSVNDALRNGGLAQASYSWGLSEDGTVAFLAIIIALFWPVSLPYMIYKSLHKG